MAMYSGRVSGFAPRSESGVFRKRMTLVWDFRLERQSPDGKPLPRIAVQMRGKYFRGGSISNGDVVELSGGQDRHGLVAVTSVKNLTAGTTVRVRSYNASVVLLYLLFVVVVCGGAAAIVNLVLNRSWS
jgi:hypothetical protein